MRGLGFEHPKEKLIYMKTRTELDWIKAREKQVLRLKQSLADEVLDHKIDVRFLTITYQRAGMTIDVIIKEWRGVEQEVSARLGRSTMVYNKGRKTRVRL